MDYALPFADGPTTIPGGSAIVLLHPSIGATDRIDTDFLGAEDDVFFVISTRTTAREVKQKLEYYDVDETNAVILDTLSVDRGYSRRATENVHYVSAPNDLDGIIEQTRRFFESTTGKRRISLDSVTELAYYSSVDATYEAVKALLELLEEYNAIGLFHLSKEVHDDETIERFTALFNGVVDLHDDGSVTTTF